MTAAGKRRGNDHSRFQENTVTATVTSHLHSDKETPVWSDGFQSCSSLFLTLQWFFWNSVFVNYCYIKKKNYSKTKWFNFNFLPVSVGHGPGSGLAGLPSSESFTRSLSRCQLGLQKSQGSVEGGSACKLICIVGEGTRYLLGYWTKGLISAFSPSDSHVELLTVIQFPKCTKWALSDPDLDAFCFHSQEYHLQWSVCTSIVLKVESGRDYQENKYRQFSILLFLTPLPSHAIIQCFVPHCSKTLQKFSIILVSNSSNPFSLEATSISIVVFNPVVNSPSW